MRTIGSMLLPFSLMMASSLALASNTQNFLLCRVTGMNDIAYRVEYADIEDDFRCPIVLPTKLTDYEFRVSRHSRSGNLRVVIENKKTSITVTALGGKQEAILILSLSDEEATIVGRQLGFNDGHKYKDILILCNPNLGQQSEYYRPIKGNDSCYKD